MWSLWFLFFWMISLFYIKPQLKFAFCAYIRSCFIPLFYIKPQPPSKYSSLNSVVLYLYSTSNHNRVIPFETKHELFYTSILHQTTTRVFGEVSQRGCFIPLFYIKPQLKTKKEWKRKCCFIPLFYIKPQLRPMQGLLWRCCFIPLFYIKPQLCAQSWLRTWRCFIPLFYIKPQRRAGVERARYVVLYLYSTSNHNNTFHLTKQRRVVLYLYSTSNHNGSGCGAASASVVLYLYSTSNHNIEVKVSRSDFVVLYLYSTSNHNDTAITNARNGLFYTSILHQTTTVWAVRGLKLRCFIPLFYIKPQRWWWLLFDNRVVLYLYSTSNHNEATLLAP